MKTNKCQKCNALCCKHVAIAIDTPENEEDYDNIRWYLLHKNIWVMIDHADVWVAVFNTPCRHITKKHTCGDYKNRPKICKDYPGENELCEGETDEKAYKTLFRTVRDFEKYLKRK
jgi:Fe-S-cluster containining protein